MKVLKKFIPIIVIISILISYILPIHVFAADNSNGTNVEIAEEEFNGFSEADGWFGALDGLVGLLTWPFRAMVSAAILASETIISQVILGGDVQQSGFIIDMEDIIFAGMTNTQTGVNDQVNMLDVNFFDLSDKSGNDMLKIKQAVAKWYYILRNIAIGLSLVVLIYMGIRMAISAIAEEKAKYKSMIKDWLIGFVMLFVLHFIIVAIINVTSLLTGIIYSAGNLDRSLSNYENALMANMFSASLIVGIGSTLVILLMLGMKIAFFWMYLKRVFTVGFLIVISPLITVTYSIDKLGDGKSQALGTWMREFAYNLLIQPFHCIMYLIFVSTAIEMLSTGAIRGIIFACMGMLFMFKAEEIIKHIFGFGGSHTLGKLAEAAAVTSLLSSAGKSGGSVGNVQAVGPVAGANGGANPVVPGGPGAPGGANPGGVNRRVPPGGVNPRGGANQGGANQGGANQGGANQGGANQGGANQGGANQGGANQGGANQGGANQGGANQAVNPAVAPAVNQAVGGGNATSRLDSASRRDKIRSKLNQIKADPKQAAKEAGKNAALDIKSIAMKTGSKVAKYAPGVATGMIVTGMSGSGITGFAAGKGMTGRYTRNISNNLDQRSAELKDEIIDNQDASMEQALHDQEERDLLANVQAAQNEYYKWHPDDEKDISEKAEELLDKNPESIDDKQERKYAESLQKLKEFHEEDSLEGSEQKVLDSVNDMNDKQYKPLSRAVDNLMDTPNYVSESKLKTNTNAWMEQMDRSSEAQQQIQEDMKAKQEEIKAAQEAGNEKERKERQKEYNQLKKDHDNSGYLKSDSFKNLSKDEQKVAREMYVAKKTMETRFNTGRDSTPEKSRNRANKQLAKEISKSYNKSKNKNA